VNAPILDSNDTSLLERLTLGADPSAIRPGAGGLRRTRGRGVGTEFQDYRPYQPGDDLRAIDWTVEARLHQLVVRVPRAHGHLRVHVLIDVSASMSLGIPSKLTCAARAAAALCYLAARHRDAAGVSTFRDRVSSYMPPNEGRAQLLRTLEMLATLAPSGESSIDRALEHYAAAASGPGIAVVLSDYFEPGAGVRGLQYLLYRGLRPIVLQVVAREEISPVLTADTELVDVEQPNAERLVVDPGVVAAYRARLAHHDALLRDFCAANGCPRGRLLSDMAFPQIIAALEDIGVISAGES
jgi:uncharacterized protein (DUF58 family)